MVAWVAGAAAVFVVGGALRWSAAIVAILVALSLIPFVLSRRVARSISPLVAVYAVCITLTALQLAPLPTGLLQAADATGEALRADGAAVSGVSSWHAITLDAAGSLRALTFFVTLLAFAVVALRIAVTERGRLICLGGVAAVCGITAGIVGVHQIFGATSLYGIYDPIQATPPVLGPLLNANHLGGLMALGSVLSLGLVMYGKQSMVARWAWGTTAIGCAIVVLASLSRGALLAMTIGAGVTLGVLAAQRLARPADRMSRSARRRFVMTTLPIGIVAVCVTFIVVFTSAGTAAEQLQNVSAHEIHEPKSKYAAWQSSMQLLDEAPWTGIGRGALEPVLTRVHPASSFVTFSHLENEYLQAFIEWGIAGGIVIMGILGWIVVVALRKWRDGPLTAGALGALAAVAVQSNVDFGVELLGLAVPATIVAATLAYVPLQPLKPGLLLLRARGILILHILALAGAAALLFLPATRSVAEDHIVLDERPSLEVIRDCIARHPFDYYGYAIGAETLARDHDTEAVAMLNHALMLHPTHSGLHRFSGELLLASGYIDQAAGEFAAAMHGASDPRGVLYEIDHRFTPAKAADAIPVDYDNVELVIRTLALDKHSDIALAWVERVVGEHPRSLATLDMMYSLAIDQNDQVTAERALRQRLAIATDPHTTLLLARMIAKRGDHDEVLKRLGDVTTWHGMIDDQLQAWLLLCDTRLAQKDLDETERCLHHLDAAGILVPAQRGELVRRLEAVSMARKEQALIEHPSTMMPPVHGVRVAPHH